MAHCSPNLFRSQLVAFITLMLPGTPVLGASYDECLQRTLQEGVGTLTLAELKTACRAEQTAAVGKERPRKAPRRWPKRPQPTQTGFR
jgi:hypothetical protein